MRASIGPMSTPRSRALLVFVLAAALTWHLLAVFAGAWVKASKERHARDFASYYYAVQVAADGRDPYDRRELAATSREDRTRRSVYPFFYPPPFLLGLVWALPLELTTAYRVWFWFDELCLLATALALWRWWRPLGKGVGVLLAVAVATQTAIPNNHLMGQANLPVMCLVVLGLWQEERGRPVLGGGLVGAACLAKMSPALFVAWWVLRGRWRAVAASIGVAAGFAVASLAVVAPAHQLRFYLEVLPGFGTGSYNELSVPIDLFGNHSIPNLYHLAFPGTGALSPTAGALSVLTALALVGGVAWALRREPTDSTARAAQISAVAVVMLLVPVYTYEHHLVWVLPAVVVTAHALVHGRLRRR